MLSKICGRLKALVPREFNNFSRRVPLAQLKISNGDCIISPPVIDGHTTLTDVTPPSQLSSEIINWNQKVTGNKFTIKQKYVIATITKGMIHTQIRIMIKANEQLAFEHYKSDIKDSIFIIPIAGSASKSSKSTGLTADNKTIEDEFRVVIYLHRKVDIDINRMESIQNSYKIRDYIVRALIGFRTEENQEGSTVDFVRNNYEFSTVNTLICSLDFRVEKILYPIDIDFGFDLNHGKHSPQDLRK